MGSRSTLGCCRGRRGPSRTRRSRRRCALAESVCRSSVHCNCTALRGFLYASRRQNKNPQVAATWIQGIEGYSYHVVNCWDLPTDPNRQAESGEPRPFPCTYTLLACARRRSANLAMLTPPLSSPVSSLRVVICACVSPETCALGMADDDAVQDSENCDLSNVYRFEVDVAQGRLVEARPCALAAFAQSRCFSCRARRATVDKLCVVRGLTVSVRCATRACVQAQLAVRRLSGDKSEEDRQALPLRLVRRDAQGGAQGRDSAVRLRRQAGPGEWRVPRRRSPVSCDECQRDVLIGVAVN